MSGIFGLCSFDQRPVPPESLNAMQAVMSSWGPDGCTHWRQDNAALGQALLEVTPASRFEVMPLHDPDRKQVLVAAARLDNRDELCDSFGIPYPERPATPDGRLIQLAYERWGESCPKKLYGDWSFAVWDYGRQRLFLARDQLGSTGLFYYHQPPFFAFASSLKALLALPEVPRRLNEMQLARYLSFFFEIYNADTFWFGIEQLLPGFRIAVTSAGSRLEHYWRLEEAPALRLGSDQEYLEGFLDHYRRAVCCRLDSLRPVGATLSSGLDSGSVTALAAEALQSRGEILTAFTSVPLYPADSLVPKNVAADEWHVAQVLAKHLGNVDHLPIRAESITPVAALERSLKIFGEPPPAPSNTYWFLAIFEEVKKRRLGVLLTGELGNGSVSWCGGKNRIFFQLAKGQFQDARNALTAWKQRQGCSWLSALKHHLLRPPLAPFWSRRQRLIRPFSSAPANGSFIQAEFARRLGLRQRMRDHLCDTNFNRPNTPAEERYETLWFTGVGAGPFYHSAGPEFGFQARHPAADVRLVEYCLGIPEEQYTHTGGEKMLLRRGLAGSMPAELLWSPRKGLQAADLPLRLLAHRYEAETWLSHLSQTAGPQEYLHLDALHQTWHFLKNNHAHKSAFLSAVWFMRGLAAGMCITQIQGPDETSIIH